MKRIHLFEFEDQSWFPPSWRMYMTNLINVVHRFLGTAQHITDLLSPFLKKTNQVEILDLCSGSGGPMIEVFENLKKENPGLKLHLSDYYPHSKNIKRYSASEKGIDYLPHSIDAQNPPEQPTGLRTMICSFHHMPEASAKNILASAERQKQPIFIFEISDNSLPLFISWLALPINFITCLLITPFVRPLRFYQLFFTYLIPVIPFFYAWDGAISNMRTYTLEDLDEILPQSQDYVWEKGVVKGKSKLLYLKGYAPN